MSENLEPWHIGPGLTGRSTILYGCNGMALAVFSGSMAPTTARRAAACVNALAGIPTDVIETSSLESLARLLLAKAASEAVNERQDP